MTNKEKCLNLLGLATRANKLISGDETTLVGIKKDKVKLVIVANDASEATIKKFKDKCNYYVTPILVTFTKAEMSHAIGKSRAIIGVCDLGFSRKIRQLMEEE